MTQLNVPGHTLLPTGIVNYVDKKGRHKTTTQTFDLPTAMRLLSLGYLASGR